MEKIAFVIDKYLSTKNSPRKRKLGIPLAHLGGGTQIIQLLTKTILLTPRYIASHGRYFEILITRLKLGNLDEIQQGFTTHMS